MAYRTRREPDHGHPWAWTTGGLLTTLLISWLRLPGLPLLWLGLFAAASSVKPDMPRRKTDRPDPRLTRRYHQWRNLGHGLTPSKQWARLDTLGNWISLGLPLLASIRLANPLLLLPINLLAGYAIAMGVINQQAGRLDARNGWTADRRHRKPRLTFTKLKQAPRNHRLLFLATLLAGLGIGLAAGSTRILPPQAATGLALLIAPLGLLADRSRQLADWRDTVAWQKRLDQWFSDPDNPLYKTWHNTYVSTVRHVGNTNNPLTLLRVRMPYTAASAWKTGSTALSAQTARHRLPFCWILPARRNNHIDPNWIRLALAHDPTALPHATDPTLSNQEASVVFQIAYARCAQANHLIPPLVTAHNVSADPKKPAWLLTFDYPSDGGPDPERMGVDWLADPTASPGRLLGIPIIDDIRHNFHLAANPDTPLSETGRKHADTQGRGFQTYINQSRAWHRFLLDWEKLGVRLQPPSLDYGTMKTFPLAEGGQLVRMNARLDSASTPTDYARLDIRALNPSNPWTGFAATPGTISIITVTPGAPARLDGLAGNRMGERLYAQSLIWHAIARNVKTPATVSLPVQEGRNQAAIWTAVVTLGGGATSLELRKHADNIKAMLGAAHTYWQHTDTNTAVLWAMREQYDGASALRYWAKPARQKAMLRVMWADAWGKSGLTGHDGSVPDVVSMRKLPKNPRMMEAQFRLPDGLSFTQAQNRSVLQKFLVQTKYQYGRALPRADRDGADKWTVLLCETDPFPRSVAADWQAATRAANRDFPMGANDMGEPVAWNAAHTPHILVLGGTGSGKSSLMQTILAQALLKGWRTIVIDIKKGASDFQGWADSRSSAFVNSTDDYEHAYAAVKWAETEMQRRVRLLTRNKASSIEDLPPAIRPPHLLVAFDEFNSVAAAVEPVAAAGSDIAQEKENIRIRRKNKLIKDMVAALGAIAAQGRSAGVNMMIGAQQLSSQTFDPKKFRGAKDILGNCGTILLGKPGKPTSDKTMNETIASALDGGVMPVGRGVYRSAQGEYTALQTWWAGGLQALSRIVANVPKQTEADLTPWLAAKPQAASSPRPAQPPSARPSGRPDAGEEPEEMDFEDVVF